MNPELLNALSDAVSIADRLLSALNQRRDELSQYINGPILKEYQNAIDVAIDKAENLRSNLVDLQTLSEWGR